MDRRSFLTSMIAAGIGSMILPGAKRRWVKSAGLYRPTPLPRGPFRLLPDGYNNIKITGKVAGRECEVSVNGILKGSLPEIGEKIFLSGFPDWPEAMTVASVTVESHGSLFVPLRQSRF